MELNKNIYDTHTKMMQSHLNVGYGSDISILELANIIKQVVGFEGGIKFNSEKPDGAPQKLMDSSRLNHLGWKPKIDLELGLKNTYRDFLMHFA